ncbi:phosphotransferase family protein [Arthrobacter sp. I2-34]|uniref:Phosphotransferase family protein n=1 Tax=Arthrobacter hankyongi TaxID=2904801 RepID=A0ABS9L3L9_9MICC|nr:phosphotransferase family protein [Arthrobacter hankyongi]MCG2621297.1 phosphotransferase family protein [Arthrobacter hankyongi]
MTVDNDHRVAPASLSDELKVANWLLTNAVETLQCSVVPALESAGQRLPAAHASRSAHILAWLSERLGNLSADPEAYAGVHDLAGEIAQMGASADRVLELLNPPSPDTVSRAAIDVAGLEAYLRSDPLAGPDVCLGDVVQLPGGRSKTTLALTLHDAAGYPREVIMRKDQETKMNGTSVVAEAGLLERLHRAGLKVPKPLRLETDPGRLGSAFLIMERLRGTTAGDVFEPPANEGLALQLAEQVGLLHAIGVEDVADDPFLAGKDLTSEQLKAQLAEFRQTVEQYSAPYASVLGALDWLEAHVDGIEARQVLVHGDLGFHNVLADGNELTGVLDWELAHLGHPARDLGYLRSTIEMMTTWPLFLEVYHEAGGVECDALAVDFYMLFSSVWLYQHLSRTGRLRFESNARHIEYANSYMVLLPNMRLRLARELEAVLDRH